MALARVAEGPRTHMMLRADFPEGPYLLDIGFGGYLLTAPVRLRARSRAEYRDPAPSASSGEEPDWILQAKLPAGWHDLYRFTLEPQIPADYVVANWYTSGVPHFRFSPTICSSSV